MRFRDDFTRHSSFMVLATTIGNAFNLFYQLYMVRALTPINYGILNSLLAMLVIISIPIAVSQTITAKFVSTFHAYDQWGKINFFVSNLTKKMFLFGLVSFSIIVLKSRYISSFFQISTVGPMIMVGFLMLFSVFIPIAFGGLQGLQKFGWLGLNLAVGPGIKFGTAVFLISLGYKVNGALGAYIISSFIILFLAFIPLRYYITKGANKVFSPRKSDYLQINFLQIYKYFFSAIILSLCFGGLINTDVILVKHFFSPIEAGYYSIAQMVGKLILFLPMAVVTVMFPKVSNIYAQNKDTVPILKKSLIAVGLLCGITTLFCVSLPSLVIRLLSGKEILECIPLVRLFAISMTFFVLVYTLLNYHLSIYNMRCLYPLIICTLIQIILIVLFHNTLLQVLYILCANSISLFIINLSLVRRRRKQERLSEEEV